MTQDELLKVEYNTYLKYMKHPEPVIVRFKNLEAYNEGFIANVEFTSGSFSWMATCHPDKLSHIE